MKEIQFYTSYGYGVGIMSKDDYQPGLFPTEIREDEKIKLSNGETVYTQLARPHITGRIVRQ